MKLTKLGGKGILLTPQTAMEENFIYYLSEMIEAKEAKFLSEHALELQSLGLSPSPNRQQRKTSKRKVK